MLKSVNACGVCLAMLLRRIPANRCRSETTIDAACMNKFLLILATLLIFPGQNIALAADTISSDAQRLDQAIGNVIQKSEYQWRMPHQKPDLPEGSFLGRVMETLNKYLMKGITAVKRWIDAIQRWIERHSPRQSLPRDHSGPPSSVIQRRFLIGLIAVAVAVLLFTLWRIRKRNPEQQLIAQPVAVVPDLDTEDVAADALPEDGWQSLARDLAGRGEYRLALRAFYMASLAFLARSELITIAKFKSNREYQKELNRRAHSYRNLPDRFSDTLDVFERSWYGNHAVNQQLLNEFIDNQEQIRRSVIQEAAHA